MKSFKTFTDLHEKAKKDVYANPNWKGQSGLEALGSVLKNTVTGRGAAGIKDDDRKAREKAAKNYSGQSGLQGITSVLKNTLTGRGAAGIRQDAEAHRRRNDPSYVPKSEKPKTEKPKTEKPKTEKPKTEKPKTEKPKTEKPEIVTQNPPGGGSNPPAPKPKPRPSVRPEKPTAKTDPRNAEYIKKRDAAKAATGDAKKKATADAESAGMAAWKKANKGLAAAKEKRDATRGTSKTTNPLMKDMKSSMPDPKPKSKPLTAPLKKMGDTDKTVPTKPVVSKADTPAVKKPPTVVPANTGSGRDGTFGSGTSGKGMPSNPPIRAKAPEVKTPTPIKVEPYQGKSKGGEVKKKTKKESFLGFADYLAEKKTKIKLNPKKDDLLEGGCGSYSKGGDVKKNHGEDCDCMKCEKKRRKDDLGDEKTVSTEDYAYVSQEKVSEESYQEEGYETETDLTEASFDIGPGHRGAMRGKKIYDKGKGTSNPHEKDTFLKRTGPQLPLAKSNKSLETAGYEPETDGEQLDELVSGVMSGVMSKVAKKAIKPGGSNPLGVKNSATSAGGGKTFTNNARLLARSPGSYTRGPVPPASQQKPMAKPNPMNAGLTPGKALSSMASVGKKGAPSGLAGANAAASNLSKVMKKPASNDMNQSISDLPSTSRRKKSELGRLKGLKASMKEAIDQVYEDRSDDAKASLEKVKKRQGVLDDYEKKTGKKLDINKSVEVRDHKKNFPGAKRTGKKVKGAKETELETHNRRVNKYSERLRKYGKTKKQKRDDDAMAKHASRFD